MVQCTLFTLHFWIIKDASVISLSFGGTSMKYCFKFFGVTKASSIKEIFSEVMPDAISIILGDFKLIPKKNEDNLIKCPQK